MKTPINTETIEEINLPEAIEKAISELAAERRIVDSGQRRWSEQDQSWQIVWRKADA